MSLLAISYPQIDPVALQIGPIAVRWYGLAYAAGLILGWVYIKRLVANASLWRDNKPAMTADDVDELLLWVAAGVVVGGRLGHVLFYEPSYYFENPLQVFAIWRGGMAFHGGLLGSGLAMFLFARRKGLVALSVMDVVAAAVPIGLFFGRMANFVNGEIVGTPTDMPWGMVFPGWGEEPRHPAMLYEAALEGIVLFLILRFVTHKWMALKQPGLTTGIFLVGYAVFRIFCEFFKIIEYRQFSPEYPITKGMVYSIPMLLLGIWFIMLARSKSRAST
ncbi:Prolipoprotein diacylglyceryl transferase [Candidatus Filomicrobium marinum]|uniref:Phosphatidylglycerol--prolipoprotein diacylglyceryl transferase n=2 Tax=Filomicrobium TaxID=119044 RepID=A0A0D6JGC0_9HYPH|nr:MULTISPECIES: prolipoprotein diacylglyceryl transferase [Filomicrobium]MCV0369854.1 prolipoprotein diacylglyceryl transferase [Filomicrobium sp.]CFX52031.1 Prolipoprotein diacylglyceryl transferase [Candidatus Filomicrobium marinum]CPR20067.1 Prolipoprotein diacylglyceryl transferase [Candidatus Filomicrobium marinum]SDP09588.1 Prolipoprotein diacylglyceryl transferase [Filomicrobium insigne]